MAKNSAVVINCHYYGDHFSIQLKCDKKTIKMFSVNELTKTPEMVTFTAVAKNLRKHLALLAAQTFLGQGTTTY